MHDAPVAAQGLVDKASVHEQNESSSRDNREGRERKSRDRYGRDRRGRGERGDRQEQQGTTEGAGKVEASESGFANTVPQDAVVAAAPVAQTPSVQPGAEASTVAVQGAPSVAPAPIVVPVEAIVGEVVAPAAVAAAPAETAPVAGLPKVASYTLPADALITVASSVGLQWVQSDAAKVAQVQAQIAAEPKPVHVPRERPVLPPLSTEPLILVETRKDLAAVSFPFDQSAV